MRIFTTVKQHRDWLAVTFDNERRDAVTAKAYGSDDYVIDEGEFRDE